MAYALYSPRVGYCQGLNFVVGGLLLAGFSEEEAFWGLHHLMKKHYLEGMFLPGMYIVENFYTHIYLTFWVPFRTTRC